MRFEGRLEKNGKWWIAEVPAFDAMTQGRTKREAYLMVGDLLETMVNLPRFKIDVHVPKGRGVNIFEVSANRLPPLVALLLRRQRERQGLTLAQVSKKLGQKSKNAYARYEQGKAMPTVEKLDELLRALSPSQEIIWRIAA